MQYETVYNSKFLGAETFYSAESILKLELIKVNGSKYIEKPNIMLSRRKKLCDRRYAANISSVSRVQIPQFTRFAL